MIESITAPITVLDGAGSLNHVHALIDRYGTIEMVAGSLFVFKGKYRAVLINFPNLEEKEELLRKKVKNETNPPIS